MYRKNYVMYFWTEDIKCQSFTSIEELFNTLKILDVSTATLVVFLLYAGDIKYEVYNVSYGLHTFMIAW